MHVAEKSAKRVPSLDLIRGLVMVLMVIDHVRVYTPVSWRADLPQVFSSLVG